MGEREVGERGEARGRKKMTGGGGEMMAGREGVQGTGVVDRRIAGGIPAVPMEGGEAEGRGCRRLGALPWLPVKEN